MTSLEVGELIVKLSNEDRHSIVEISNILKKSKSFIDGILKKSEENRSWGANYRGIYVRFLDCFFEKLALARLSVEIIGISWFLQVNF